MENIQTQTNRLTDQVLTPEPGEYTIDGCSGLMKVNSGVGSPWDAHSSVTSLPSTPTTLDTS